VKKTGIIIVCLLSVSVWGQQRNRKIVRPEVSRESATSDSGYRPVTRSMRGATRSANATVTNTAAVPQARGVLQINLSDTLTPAWFVVTDTIPQGSSVIAYVAPAGDNFLKLGPYTFNRDILPGESLALPKVADFGYFWPSGVTTYDVVVRVNGTDTHSAADFTVGAGRNYNDLGVVQPIIYNWSESSASRQVLLTITGWFTADPVKVVLEDIVVPAGAITQSSDGSTVTVNLSKVPGLPLDVYGHFLLTVGQAGFSDTSVFTHVPFNPASYDLAP
jgi:hypothetical protein